LHNENWLLCAFRDEITFPKLLSIGRVSSGAGRPVFYFHLSTTFSKSDIEQNWRRGGQETDESTELYFFHLSEIESLPEKPIWDDISPNGHLSLISMTKSRQLAR